MSLKNLGISVATAFVLALLAAMGYKSIKLKQLALKLLKLKHENELKELNIKRNTLRGQIRVLDVERKKKNRAFNDASDKYK